MSTFLGSIHFWMYRKIQSQEELIYRIAAKAEAELWAESKEIGRFVNVESRPLEQIIDKSDIHGWLLEAIESAESRYAELVTRLLTGHADRLTAMKQIVYDFGAEHAAEENMTAEQCYKKIEDITLNGMPCDSVNIIIDKDDTCFSWKQRLDVHSSYWQKVGGDPEVYFILCNQLMAGVMSRTLWNIYTADNKQYVIR